MKFSYDAEADALTLHFSDNRFADSIEVAPGVQVDVNEAGQPISIEVLGVRERTNLQVDITAALAEYNVVQEQPAICQPALDTMVSQRDLETVPVRIVRNSTVGARSGRQRFDGREISFGVVEDLFPELNATRGTSGSPIGNGRRSSYTPDQTTRYV